MIDDSLLTNEQTYDAALASIVMRLRDCVIPFVNEAFGESFTKAARVNVRNNKHVVPRPDGSLVRRETDIYLEIAEGGTRKLYHFEVEAWYDDTIILRVAEYSSAIAVENASYSKGEVVLEYPDSVVIFLRPSDRIPGKLRIVHRFPNGAEASYEAPVFRVGDYTLEDIFEKRLLIILPFYLFRYADDFGRMEQEEDRRRVLTDDIAEIDRRLSELVKDREIGTYHKRIILELLKRVSDKLVAKYDSVRKGVDEAMSGYILRTETDEIYERGIREGREEGREEGRKKGREEGREEGKKEGAREGKLELSRLMNHLLSSGRNEDAMRATVDGEFMEKLLEEFKQGLLATN